jgi:hypothetical protein
MATATTLTESRYVLFGGRLHIAKGGIVHCTGSPPPASAVAVRYHKNHEYEVDTPTGVAGLGLAERPKCDLCRRAAFRLWGGD